MPPPPVCRVPCDADLVEAASPKELSPDSAIPCPPRLLSQVARLRYGVAIGPAFHFGGLGSTTPHKFAAKGDFGEIKKSFCAQMGTEFGVGNCVALLALDSRCFMGTCFSVRQKFSQKDVCGLVGCGVTDQRATQTVCNTTPLWWLFVSWFDLSTRSSYRPLALHLEKNFPSSALWADIFQTKFLVGCFWLDVLNVQRNKWWDSFKMLDLVAVAPLFVQPMLWEDVHFVADALCPMPCDFLSKFERTKKI